MNILPTKRYLAIVVAGLVLPLFSCAASFDCAKATIGVEKLICENKTLLKLDSDLEQVYTAALEAAENKKELKKAQRKWIKEKRNQCADANCLINVYGERISYLKVADPSPSNIGSHIPSIDTSSLNTSIKPSELYTFERLVSGIETCDLKNVHIDAFTKEPVNPYFIHRKLKPILLNNDMAEYEIKEEFYGLPVYKIVLPHHFPVFAIYIDAPIDEVIEKLSPFLTNGFYTSFPDVETFDKPLIMKDEASPEKTSLTCD